MNIEAVLSAVNQSTAPQTPGPTTAQTVNDNGNGSFKQMLTAMVQHANQPLNGTTAKTIATNQQPDWLTMLMNIFGQDTDSGMLSLDPTGEAALPSDTTISLTDVMAALQTIVPQENLTDLTDMAAANITPEQLESLLKDHDPSTTLDDDTINTLLAVIGAPATNSDLPPMLPQLLQQLQAITTDTEQASPQAGQSLPNLDQASAQTVTSTPSSTPTTATSATFQTSLSAESTTPAAPPPTTETATYSTPTAPPYVESATTSATTSPSATATLSQSETPQTQSQSNPVPLPTDTPVSAPTTTAPTAPTFAVPETTPTTHSATLPNIPALHQIVKSIELISHNDKNSVRLQLHPESLGQILIQLDHSHGNVTVRMLAETVQAQHLVQDHLPQLKQAFAAQGLQADYLSVAVGSDASAFDAPDHPAQRGFQGTSQQNFTPTLNRGEQHSPVSSITRSGSSLHAVDYQV